MKNTTITLLITLLLLLGGCVQETPENTTTQTAYTYCDAQTPCAEGNCIQFEEMSHAYCYTGDPCQKCPTKKCNIIETNPKQIKCIIEYCTEKTLENCDTKKVNITGEINPSKTLYLCNIENKTIRYTWLGNCIQITNPENIPPETINKKAEIIGTINASDGELCGAKQIEECAGKYHPTKINIEKIKVKEETTTTTTTTRTTIDCPPISTPSQCTDTDRGIDTQQKGTITGFFGMPQAGYNHTDTCKNYTTIKEYYCNRTCNCHGECVTREASEEIKCPEGYNCIEGECTKTETEKKD